jgi:hypothetical protein
MPRIERDPRFRTLQGAAVEQGWAVESISGQHWKFIPQDKTKRPVVASGSPSDWRSFANFIAELRRSGLVIPKNMR